ncbi:MAG: hypothetical protein R3B95_08085 [Nitrospirales bacterium]|nr:hypothetical protein [Nitrospirales bacterium]
MMASFFKVGVCSLTRSGEQTQPAGKKEAGAIKAKGRGRRSQAAQDYPCQSVLDSGAACAGPKALNRPAKAFAPQHRHHATRKKKLKNRMPSRAVCWAARPSRWETGSGLARAGEGDD